ncbi:MULTISPECIES: hypothetical protein [Luteibacter]|uniref:hypothetical protein n=1 Tax=Luteibacter TaxID=242605 RepID=UPI000568BE81|nr:MULTISPECIES: hypothetical protein [unclassified Luteibacter]
MRYLYVTACLMIVPTFAIASPQEAGGRAQQAMSQLTQRFNQADKDRDGKLTRDEAKAGMPRIAEHFDDIDSEHRGYITLEQFQSAIRSRMGS